MVVTFEALDVIATSLQDPIKRILQIIVNLSKVHSKKIMD